MNNKTIKTTFMVPLFLLASCSTTASFYPVEGPLSKQVPLPTVIANVNGIMGNTGDINLNMPDGEKCSGKWSSAAGAGVSFSSGSMISQYGALYGTGFTASTGHGQNPGQAFMSCVNGRSIQMEFVTGAGTANGFGFAKDNKGNVYKVLF